ncbi:flagellin [Pseudalkalibacillus hwajinpoensis]|nr:flagellin [Pseudalkalibacillus hwajinpoensis]WLR61841.1 flagellin [Pseudalkalibacillus hwajinpoensis]
MIINHNISALNTYRQMGVNQNEATGSMEKLSSGLRINKASDDAAGLSISEKMRGQIRGLDQASRNAQDGVSLIQTAEGALSETQNILQRMRELSVQGSNDTNTADDRNQIQKEINELGKEIDRIAKDSEFNTQNLLDGSFKGSFQIGANEGQKIDLSIGAMSSSALGLNSGVELQTVTGAGTDLLNGTYTVDGTDLKDSAGNKVGTVSADTVTLADTSNIQFDKTSGLASGDTIKISDNGDTATLSKAEVAGQSNSVLGAGSYDVKDNGSGSNLDVFKGDTKVGTVAGTTFTATDGTSLELGTTYGMNAPVDGDSFSINGIDVSNGEMAEGSITAIDKALKFVSEERSKLGASQNRLEHTINNLNTSSENITAAESRIRDVDMAKEMMTMTKENIKAQAAQAMLAQANQAPQQVLQLLR